MTSEGLPIGKSIFSSILPLCDNIISTVDLYSAALQRKPLDKIHHDWSTRR